MTPHTAASRVQISAKKGTGVDELLETVLLMAEVEQLAANPAAAARGTVIEAHLDRRQGAVAALLVANGTLRAGDVVQAGATFGRARSPRALLGCWGWRRGAGRRGVWQGACPPCPAGVLGWGTMGKRGWLAWRWRKRARPAPS